MKSRSVSDITIKSYQDKFEIYKEKTTNIVSGEFKVWLDLFYDNLTPNRKIFELWSAHWRDARYLKQKWFHVYCTDIISQALHELLQDWFETSLYDFRDDVKEQWINTFDWVLANAVLLHAPHEIFSIALNRLVLLLKSDGILAFSLKNWKWDEIIDEKIWADRYFLYHSENEILKTLSVLKNITLLSIVTTNDWKRIHVIARKNL